MNICHCAKVHTHLRGESATHPRALRWIALAALLLLAGMSPKQRRALPARPITALSDASNGWFKVEITDAGAVRNFEGTEVVASLSVDEQKPVETGLRCR